MQQMTLATQLVLDLGKGGPLSLLSKLNTEVLLFLRKMLYPYHEN